MIAPTMNGSITGRANQNTAGEEQPASTITRRGGTWKRGSIAGPVIGSAYSGDAPG